MEAVSARSQDVAVRRTARIAVLVSGAGSNLAALLAAIDADSDFGGQVVVVASDRADAGGLQKARAAGVATLVHQPASFPDRASWERALVADLRTYEVDLVVLAGFMRILTDLTLSHWPGRIVNVHPSLLPAFRGAHAVRDALAHGVKLTGVTVHLVDELVDHGPILAQRAVEVLADDTEASLHARIQQVEHELLPACVAMLCRGRLQDDVPGMSTTSER